MTTTVRDVEILLAKIRREVGGARARKSDVRQVAGNRAGRKPKVSSPFEIPQRAREIECDTLPISRRLKRMLNQMAIKRLGDLQGRTPRDLRGHVGFGAVT